MKFELQKTDSKSNARAGKITTQRGTIETPVFMPVGTLATVKGIHQRELKNDIGAQIILANTYHLFLRPGTGVLSKAGGLHKFMGWDKPILTDSGGYQVFSLNEQRKITEEGVIFKSHIDGSAHLFSPEKVMDIQREIGADFVMAFDECPPYPCTEEYAKESMHRTHRWLDRCIQRFDQSTEKYGQEQNLLPIIQGSVFSELRRQSAEFAVTKNLSAHAIGGLSVGEPAELMYAITQTVCGILPADKPRYLMGVGTPANVLESISLGIDMLDCVLPTRNARHGLLFTSEGVINIKNEKWKSDFSVLDPQSDCFADRDYSKAYLRHLFSVNELLGAQIASIHNLHFYATMTSEARKKILDGSFASWKNQFVEKISRRL